MNEDGQFRFNANFSSSDDQGSEDGEIEEDMSNGEGPRKRVKADVTEPTEQTVPKWSNPEYFTALPPPESGLGPKKDIVQVIRKAKVEAAAKHDTTSNAVKENADFISFNMDDDTLRVSDEDSADENVPPENASTGPKLGNHSVTKPKDGPAPKKGSFKQFVRPRSPVLNFSLRPFNKAKDPVGPPPQPPPNIDQLMSMADRMHVSGRRKPTAHPIQEYKPEPWLPSEAIPQQSSEPKGKKRKAAKISKGLGDVVVEWLSNETNPTPWCTVDHTRTANVGLR
jgi:non-canonical poly(A) RNA polymerase PAPD5/7